MISKTVSNPILFAFYFQQNKLPILAIPLIMLMYLRIGYVEIVKNQIVPRSDDLTTIELMPYLP